MARGQPGRPSLAEISRSRQRVALNEAEQRDAMLAKILLGGARKRIKRFKDLEERQKARVEIGEELGSALGDLLKFVSRQDVKELVPNKAGAAVREARHLRHQADNPQAFPATSALVLLAALAAALRKRLGAA